MGITEVLAEALPDHKAEKVEKLKKTGRWWRRLVTAYDAPALNLPMLGWPSRRNRYCHGGDEYYLDAG